MLEEVENVLYQHEYTYIHYINKGAFGSCYLVYSQKYNKRFVCKVIGGLNIDESFMMNYQREVDALSHLTHSHIVSIYEVFSTDQYLFMILEYCSGGNLLDTMFIGKPIPIKQQIRHFIDILDALCYMHDKGIAHCDIKPSNILLDDYGRAKLCDFGLSQIVQPNRRKNSNKLCGTMNYMSPEIMIGKGYDPFKADVLSLGVTFYCLATGHLPFSGKSPESILKEIKDGYDTINIADMHYREILVSCLTFDPAQRPTMKQLKMKTLECFRESNSLKPKYINNILARNAASRIIDGKKRLSRVPSSHIMTM